MFNQLAKKLVTCAAALLARSSGIQQNRLPLESTRGQLIWNPRSRLFVIFTVATRKYVCRSLFCPPRFYNPQFNLEFIMSLLAVSVSHELQCQTSALQRNKSFCDSLPVNSRSYGRTHARTDVVLLVYIHTVLCKLLDGLVNIQF